MRKQLNVLIEQSEKTALKDICANEQLSEGRVVGRLITKEHRALVNRRSYVPIKEGVKK